MVQRHFEQRSADIFKHYIDPLWKSGCDGLGDLLRLLVIDAQVVAIIAHGALALLSTAGKTHHLCRAAEMCELTGQRADRAGRTADEHVVAGAQRGDVKHAVMRRQADATQHVCIDRQGIFEMAGQGEELARWPHHIIAPCTETPYQRTGGQLRRFGHDDFADDHAAH